jgi:hypothetical protein
MSDIIIAKYTPSDKASCISLLSTIFQGNSDEETFNWRFESNLRHSPILICAKDQEKVVSFNSWLPWSFRYQNKTFLGYQSGESATYPEYRRKGILGKILQYADEIAEKNNVDFLFGFPSYMIYRTFYNSGYYPIGIFPYRIRLMNPFAHRSSEKKYSDFSNLSPNSLCEYQKITPMDDADYRIWRYLKNPKKYLVCQFTENNNNAVFILRPTKYYNKRFHIKLDELILLDCHFSSYNEIFIRNAFKHIDKIFAKHAFHIRSFVNSNTDRGKAISNFFHFNIKSRFEILCIKPISKDIDRSVFFNYNNWDIMPHIVDEM